MNYLEKVFLGTMLLFLTIVLFFFGLYFDLYEMLWGAVKESEPLLSAGEFAYTRAAMERAARPIEIMPESLGNSYFGLPGSAEELSRLYDFMPPRPGPQAVVGWWRERLKSEGMIDGDLLEMEALGHDREAYGELMVRVNALARARDLETAAMALEEGLRAVEPRNLYVQQDMLLRLIEIYRLAGKDREAEQAARKLSEVAEQILTVKARAMNSAEMSSRAQEIVRERTAPPGATDEKAKTELKARLLRAFDEGKIDRAQLDRMLEQIK